MLALQALCPAHSQQQPLLRPLDTVAWPSEFPGFFNPVYIKSPQRAPSQPIDPDKQMVAVHSPTLPLQI